MERLAVVDSDMHDAQVLVSRCQALGVEPVLVVHEPGARSRTPTEGADGIWRMDLGSPSFEEELVGRLAADHVAGAITCSEFVMDAVHASTQRRVDGPAAPRVVHSSRDKLDMYDALSAAGIATPNLLAIGTEDGLEVLRELRWPLVVKPRDNAASKGVAVVGGPETLEVAVRRASSQSGPYGLALSSDVLLQELVPGAEYSVESVVTDDVVEHYGVVAKTTSRGSFRTELAHTFPAPITSTLADQLQATAARVIAACGFSHTHVHTEILCHRDRGPVVVEAAPRLPGGRISTLLNLATGTSSHDRVVQLALRRPYDELRPASGQATVQHLAVDQPGVFQDIKAWPPTLGSVVEFGLSKPRGTELVTAHDNSGRVAYAVFSGDPDRVARDVERFRDECRVVVGDARREAS